MRNTILCLFFLFASYISQAQDWHCVRSGAIRYFVNSNFYLRGIRIDSAKTIGTDTILYPFRTPRGEYNNFKPLDSNGGSWLGKRITIKQDGAFIFDNYWGDSVVIKTHAVLNDKWIMYGAATGMHYDAAVIAADTATILSVLDSVKTILITAKLGTVLSSSDPFNNLKIIFSKKHGFVQTTDLYMFPFHAQGKGYQQWFDYFTDIAYSYNPSIVNAIFNLVDFKNPDALEIYNFNAGDVFANHVYVSSYTNASTQITTIDQKNIVNKFEIDYKLHRGNVFDTLKINSQNLFDTLMNMVFAIFFIITPMTLIIASTDFIRL